MPRPRKRCRIGQAPPATFYKPQGVPLGQLKGVSLCVEGFEALRLVDGQGLSQEEAAGRMGVSRPTLCRILGEARSLVAKALSNGWAIRIEGQRVDAEAERGAGTVCRGRGRRCGRNGRGPFQTEEDS